MADLQQAGAGLRRSAGSHAASFLLGAALPTAALLFFLGSDHLSQGLGGLPTISRSWGCGAVPPPADGDANEVMFKGLAELLPKVAMDDRTVIITSVNEAWAQPGSLLDLYLESFKNGEDIAHLLKHLVVVALDAGGFERCKAVHPHCFLLNVTSVYLSSAKSFMTPDYLELVWTKLVFQQRVLELGYNFLFTDCDMILLRNPFRHFPVYADMSCSSDDFNPSRAPLENPLNTGLYYMKSTNRTMEMMKYWRAARVRFPGHHDQTVFVNIRHELVSKLQVKIEPLDTVYFGGFCQFHDDPDKVCSIHANCCVGLDTKVHDLKGFIADWKNYTSLTPEARPHKGDFKWTAYPKRCRNSMGWH